MARRAATVFPDDGAFRGDPLAAAVREDREGVADQLSDVLEGLSGVDQGSIKGILYRIPVPNGKYEWIREVFPPFDLSGLMGTLKEDIGGGDYALRIMAEGKPRKTIHFSIMKEKQTLVTDAGRSGDMMPMIFQMMMKQSEDASRQRAEDMRDRQAASERQMTMIVGLATAAIPVIMGGREKTSDLMQAIAAFQPKPDNNSMQETLTLLTTAKTLFGDNKPDDNKFDPDDLAGAALKFGGPIVGAIGRAFQARAGNGGAPGEAPQTDTPPRLMLPDAREPRADGSPDPTSAPSAYPVLDLIREDVLFFYGRNHDPEKAADLIYDVIEAAEVPEEEINALVTAFSISPNPFDELAANGIDLRQRPQWAQEFLASLVSIHTGIDQQSDDSGRGRGDETKPLEDGETGEGRVARNANPKPSGKPDD